MFAGLKNEIAHWTLQKNLRHLRRTRKVHNLDTANSAGILFDASNTKHFDSVQAFYQDLGKHLSEIRVLGYFQGKELPDPYLFKKNYTFFQKKDLNWYRKPVKPEVETFIKRPFDILIDLSMSDDYLFQYIVAMSAARMKVGHYPRGRHYYDLMIQVEKNPSIDYLIEQVMHYLGTINKPYFTVH
ncbi:MAG: DUF6913 domain-containing protein [Bacteroidales bacterium]